MTTTTERTTTRPDFGFRTRRARSDYPATLVKSGYAPVNGLRMYYEIHGTVAARPLVTIHPFAGLANVFPSLVRNRQLIAMELQGHGRTADIDRPMSFEQDADDVAALLKHLRIERANFFGESFGGIVALLMAVRHPETRSPRGALRIGPRQVSGSHSAGVSGGVHDADAGTPV